MINIRPVNFITLIVVHKKADVFFYTHGRLSKKNHRKNVDDTWPPRDLCAYGQQASQLRARIPTDASVPLPNKRKRTSKYELSRRFAIIFKRMTLHKRFSFVSSVIRCLNMECGFF